MQRLNFSSGISIYDDGKREEKMSVFRDSLVLVVDSFSEVDILSSWKKRRDYQRFLRFMRNHIYQSTRDLRYSKFVATKLRQLGVRFFVHTNHKEYYEMELGSVNSLNYCRVALDFEIGKVFSPTKLNDQRTHCHFDYFKVDNVHAESVYTLGDYFLAIEQKLDDLVFGIDGNGVSTGEYVMMVFQTSVVMMAVVRVVVWVSRK